jgi:hypothetical protein
MKILFALLFVSTTLMAEDFAYDPATGKAMPKFIGELKLVKGRVFKDNGGKRAGLKEGAQLYPGDTLVTEEKSFVRVLMVDQSTVNLGPNSELNFESFKYNSNTDRQSVYNLMKGQLRSIVKNKAKDGDIQFKTPQAVMGIRGTELLVNHQVIGKIDVSEFALLSGRADLNDAQGEQHTLVKNDRLILIGEAQPRKKKLPLNKIEIDIMNNEEEFLPYSPLAAIDSNTTGTDSTTSSTEEAVTTPPGKSTSQNLEKLNEQLRENVKRKR